MTYSLTEESVAQSPIELYRFVGTDNSYFLTSYGRDITIGSDTYVSTTISRDAVKVGTEQSSEIQMTVTLPVNHPMINEYIFGIGPPNLTLTLLRAHNGDLASRITYWIGEVVSFSVEGRQAKVLIPSMLTYFLNGLLPAPRYQGPCNHVLFDQFCKLPRTGGNQHVTTITSISGLSIVLDDSPYSNGECVSGEMILNGRTQRRMIMSNSGTNFTISYPFMSAEVGDEVTITIGCDHSFTRCKELSNAVNYGGFPFVPNRNPFNGRI